MTPYQLHVTVRTREDFIGFVRALADDLATNRSVHWENTRLEDYLGALHAWTATMDGYFQIKGESTPEPSWSLFALILYAAAIEE